MFTGRVYVGEGLRSYMFTLVYKFLTYCCLLENRQQDFTVIYDDGKVKSGLLYNSGVGIEMSVWKLLFPPK